MDPARGSPTRGNLAAAGLALIVCAADEHVPDEVKRFICTVKECAQCTYSSLPSFCWIPALMIKELVTSCMFWLNMFPPHDGISSTLSPHALMAGFTMDYNRHCWLEFRTYVQTHKEHDNLMESQTTRDIALCPTSNRQGGYYFMSLMTGRHLIRHHWSSLPMPKDVIDCINALGHRSLAAQDLSFTWGDGTPILDPDNNEKDYNSDYVPSELADESEDDESDDILSAAGVDDGTNTDGDEQAKHDVEGNDNEPNSASK
jgi:hypothetical protein